MQVGHMRGVQARKALHLRGQICNLRKGSRHMFDMLLKHIHARLYSCLKCLPKHHAQDVTDAAIQQLQTLLLCQRHAGT